MLSGLSLSQVALLAWVGVALDLLLGEARRWHPLVGFGRWASAIERRLNRRVHRGSEQPLASFGRGLLAWLLALVPPVLAAIWLNQIDILSWLLHALLLYFCLGLRSLREHALPIGAALASDDLPLARQRAARIVSRDTGQADAVAISKAGVESLLENGNDAVFGTLFWFVVAGGPGALLFRLANTLDAMWGYRTRRFLYFGRCAARMDDLLNLIPARLTALSYLLLAQSRSARQRAWQCWRTQAPAWASPNAGPVMASGAGALGLELGGAVVYDGQTEQRPPLGAGRPPEGADIARAWRLVAATCALWLGLLALAGALEQLFW